MANLWCAATDTIDPTGPYTDLSVRTASWVLFKLTAEKYTGIITSTDAYQSTNFDQIVLQPTVIYGNITNIPLFQPGIRNLRLRNTPVHEIVSIVSNGVVMDPSEYSLRNSAYVVRDKSIPWILEPTSDLMITYTHGSPVPAAGKLAAIRLANELIQLQNGSGMCALPERVKSVTRQGMSFAVLDPQDFIEKGHVGISDIDIFISAANPGKARKKSRVFSPDKPRGERIN